MLQIANASYSPIVQSLQMPVNSTVCSEHLLGHFNASKPNNAKELNTIIKMIKEPFFKEISEEKQDAIFSDIDEIIKLVKPKKLEDEDNLEADTDSEHELKERRLHPDKEHKKKTQEEEIDAMIKDAKQLRKDIEAMP